MIKITSFHIFRNFLRILYEFHQDKALVKIKSLTFERNFKFSYKEVSKISDGSQFANDQRDFSFYLIAIPVLVFILFPKWISDQIFWFRIAQIIYICGMFLYFTSYIKKRGVALIDKSDNILAIIQQNSQNSELIVEAIKKIKTESEKVEELSNTCPFPSNPAVFEYSFFGFSNLAKINEKFYEGEIIGFQRSVFGERAYKINYDQLSGNIYRGKQNDAFHAFVFELCALLLSIIYGLIFVFRIQLHLNIIYLLSILGVIYTTSWILSFIKRDVIGFYDKNGKIKYSAYVSHAEKENFEKIIEFVQSKIPDGNKI